MRRTTRARGGTAEEVEDELDIEGAGDNAPAPGGSADGDKSHDGRDMVSAAKAFPYEYIEGSDEAGSENANQISHISVVKMIREKRAQRRARYNIAIIATDRINESVPEDGKLDPE